MSLTHVNKATGIVQSPEVWPRQGEKRVEFRQQWRHLGVGQGRPDDEVPQGVTHDTAKWRGHFHCSNRTKYFPDFS